MVKKTEAKNSKPQSLRVLMVEDSEDDVLLIIRELKKGGYNPVYELVETAATMKKALKEKQWDIIICDYKLPKFDAPSAITLLKEANIDIPVIIVSGSIGEETAVECMRLGAHDYIMKNSLSRLCPAINRELEEAEVRNKHRQAEKALKESEEKYRTILDEMEDVYLEVDLAGNFTFFNDAILYHVGYSKEELIGTSFRDRVAKEDITNLYNTFGKIYSTGKPERSIFYKFMHKDGTMGSVEAAFFPLHNKKGKIVGFRGIARDITKRIQTEERLQKSEERYRTLVENASDLVFRADVTGHLTFVNSAVLRVLGYGKEEIVGKHYRKLIHPDMLDEVIKLFVSQLENQVQNAYYEFRTLTKDGHNLWFGQNTALVVEDGHVTGFQAIARDITELKQAEEALRKSEAQYRLLADNMNDQLWLMDLNLKPTYISPSVEKSRGYTFEEIVQLPLDKQLTATSLQSAMEFFSIEMPKALTDPTNYMTRLLELEFYRKDGSTLWVENTFSLIYDENGKPLSLLGVGRDITKRKKVEEVLHQSEERYRTILDEMADAYFEVDLAGNYTFVNDTVCRHLGYSREELIGTTFRGQMIKEEFEKIYKAFGKIYMTGKPESDIFYKLLRKDGTTRFAEMTGFPLKNQQGEVVGFRGIGRDITERKQAEEEHQQSFELMRKALRATVQAISMTVEMKDPYTSGHQQRVSDLARSIATEMGLSADQLEFIRAASAIHDIGKIAVPAEILSKPTKLTDLEFSIIKTHSQSGYDILKDIEFPWPVADVILQHHERMNGSGYPQGLKGENILMGARILAIADVVEAIASHRPYRASLGIDFALEEISRNKGILYDVDAVDACLRLFREKGFQLAIT